MEMLISRLSRYCRLMAMTVGAVFGLHFGAAAADPLVGTWTGTVLQEPAATNSAYPAEYTFTSSSAGSSKYSSLNCGGNLSGSGSGGSYRFRESITYGRATEKTGGCIDGNVELQVSGNTMNVRWTGSWQGVGYVVSGTLTRQGGSAAIWSTGKWVRGDSVSNVLGTCFTTWTCQPGSAIMRAPDSKLLSTGSQRTQGACQMTDNPKSCGRCLSYEPEARCEYCVEPNECANASLGSRTREAMGCCPAK